MTQLTKHRYELAPNGGPPFITVGEYVYPARGVNYAITKGVDYLRRNPGVQRLHLYHSYPSPGPRRRFAGVITKEGFREA